MTIGHGARAWAAYPALSAPLTMMGVERRWFLLSATLGMAMWNAVNSIRDRRGVVLPPVRRGMVGMADRPAHAHHPA